VVLLFFDTDTSWALATRGQINDFCAVPGWLLLADFVGSGSTTKKCVSIESSDS
jgi:hypothetical protein